MAHVDYEQDLAALRAALQQNATDQDRTRGAEAAQRLRLRVRVKTVTRWYTPPWRRRASATGERLCWGSGFVFGAFTVLWWALGFVMPLNWAKELQPRWIRETLSTAFLVAPWTLLAADVRGSLGYWWTWGIAVWLAANFIHRSVDAALIEPACDEPDLARLASRSFVITWLAFLSTIGAFGLLYQLYTPSCFDAIECAISFGTNIGNNATVEGDAVRLLRIIESIVGTLFLTIMIGRFAGSFSKDARS